MNDVQAAHLGFALKHYLPWAIGVLAVVIVIMLIDRKRKGLKLFG